MAFDPIQVEVWRHLFESIAEEMGATLERTGFSPNIKERRDHSCALFDADGRLLAQAAHIPVHLGAMPLMMERLRHEVAWKRGAMWLCNDPRHGGTHLPDLTLVAPVFCRVESREHPPRLRGGDTDARIAPPYTGGGVDSKSEGTPAGGETPPLLTPGLDESRPHSRLTPASLLGFVANRAHHADIGGLAPGSLTIGTELFHEGLIIPPVRLVVGNRVQPDVMALVCANSRTAGERRGDIAAQIAANRIGIRRLVELVDRYGRAEGERRAAETRQYAESVVRATLARAPDGDYACEDLLDDDGMGNRDLAIRVVARLHGGRIAFDFTGTAPEAAGAVNATEAVTRSACYYVVRCLVDEEIPMNTGAFAPVEVHAPEGSLVNARFPRAVAAGNVETSQRIVDVLLGALAPAFPDRIPAASQGTMNNLTIGGFDPERLRPFAYYETVCGGAGATPGADGASAVHSHMTNTRNTPIEALEMHYPLRVQEYALRAGSGGAGTQRGGEGVVRRVELLAPAQVSLLAERRLHAPPGRAGGADGAPGHDTLQEPDGEAQTMPAKFSRTCPAGTVITIETPGGGGWGEPVSRPLAPV